ncbi:6013_t:CDS:2, partial [Ambispora gerdemannii]
REETVTQAKKILMRNLKRTSPFEADLVKFDEAYLELDPNHMWTLKSGRKVEEVVYEKLLPRKLRKSKTQMLTSGINEKIRKIIYEPFIPDESWYEMNVWSHLVDPAFHDLNIDLVRGEGMSCVSSDRKNLTRTINDRKKIGRKGDKDRLEFGAIEAGRKWEEQCGTKYMTDSLKLYVNVEGHDGTARFCM